MKEVKKFFVRTYGCQMNELDSEVMIGMLERRGLERVENEEDADLLIFNTCWIRELAAAKAMGKMGKIGSGPKKDAIIGLTGCMANAKKETLFSKLPKLDFVLGTNNIHQLNTVLDEVLATGNQVVKADSLFHEELEYAQATREGTIKANVSIIRGCDKFCTYCCVPYTRGREVSRAPGEIIDECKKLVDQGFKEITVLGQNVNSYGKDKPEWNMLFHDLLAEIDKIDGLYRVRFMTSHPVDITRDLMLAVRDLPSLCEFVHFPIQAGSSRVLRKMHRIYTKEQYLEKVAMLKELVPNVALGTDIIVGFPTETEAEFQETYDVFKEIEYQVAFLFSFSMRAGTPAARWKDDVPEPEKQDRLHRLLRLYNSLCIKHREKMIGQEVEVLVDKTGREEGTVRGRTRCWKKVIFPGEPNLIGTLQKVKVHSFSSQTLLGDRVIAKANPLSLIA